MHTYLLIISDLLFVFMMLTLYRIWKGPTALDRLVATNAIGTKAAVLLVFIGTLYGRAEMFVDFALTYALLNFFGSLAAARYYDRVRPKESKEEAAI